VSHIVPQSPALSFLLLNARTSFYLMASAYKYMIYAPFFEFNLFFFDAKAVAAHIVDEINPDR